MNRWAYERANLPRAALMVIVSALAFAGVGCSGPSGDGAHAITAGRRAECVVCRCNADLACVDVEVDDATPRTLYRGTTYYFCSDECLARFEKDPTKYAGK